MRLNVFDGINAYVRLGFSLTKTRPRRIKAPWVAAPGEVGCEKAMLQHLVD